MLMSSSNGGVQDLHTPFVVFQTLFPRRTCCQQTTTCLWRNFGRILTQHGSWNHVEKVIWFLWSWSNAWYMHISIYLFSFWQMSWFDWYILIPCLHSLVLCNYFVMLLKLLCISLILFLLFSTRYWNILSKQAVTA